MFFMRMRMVTAAIVFLALSGGFLLVLALPFLLFLTMPALIMIALL